MEPQGTLTPPPPPETGEHPAAPADTAVAETAAIAATATVTAVSPVAEAPAAPPTPASAAEPKPAPARRPPPARHKFFFVVGHPKSGTTWAGALLNLHPQVNCMGEFHFESVRAGVEHFTGNFWHVGAKDPVRSIAWDCFEHLVRSCMLAASHAKPNSLWIGDRTPRPLTVLIPDAPNFVMVRDGRDVLISWIYHLLRIAAASPDLQRPLLGELLAKYKTDANYFKDHPEELLSQEKLVRQTARVWAERINGDNEMIEKMRNGEAPGRAMTVKYEDLHADLEATRAEMYRFLGLNPANAVAPSAENFTSAGFEKEDPKSFYRAGRVSDWMKYSNDDFKTWFKEEAGQALIDLGYEKDLNW